MIMGTAEHGDGRRFLFYLPLSRRTMRGLHYERIPRTHPPRPLKMISNHDHDHTNTQRKLARNLEARYGRPFKCP